MAFHFAWQSLQMSARICNDWHMYQSHVRASAGPVMARYASSCLHAPAICRCRAIRGWPIGKVWQSSLKTKNQDLQDQDQDRDSRHQDRDQDQDFRSQDQDQDQDPRPQDQDQDFENSVSRRLETKTQVSRTPSLHFTDNSSNQREGDWLLTKYLKEVNLCWVVSTGLRIRNTFITKHVLAVSGDGNLGKVWQIKPSHLASRRIIVLLTYFRQWHI